MGARSCPDANASFFPHDAFAPLTKAYTFFMKRASRPSRWFHFHNWSLAARLTIFTVLIAFIMQTVVTTLTYYPMRAASTTQIGASFALQAEGVADIVGLYFLQKVGQLQSLAEVEIVKENATERNNSYVGSSDEIVATIQALDAQWVVANDNDPLVQRILSADPAINAVTFQTIDFLKAFPAHTEIFATDRYGATIGATGRLSDYYQADETWWQAAWNDGQGAVYISEPTFDESAGVTALLLAVPIVSQDAEEVIGIIRSTLIVDDLANLIESITFGETGQASLFGANGNVLFSSGDMSQLPDAARLNQQFASEATGTTIIADLQREELFFSYTPVHVDAASQGLEAQVQTAVANLGWVAGVQQSTDEALASVDWAARLTGIVGIVIMAIGSLAAFFLARIITRPLSQLTVSAERIDAGNLLVNLPPIDGSEIGRLAMSFGNMVSRLQNAFSSLEQTVAERTADLTLANSQLQQEIVERKQAESVLQASEIRFRSLIQTAASPIVYLKPDGHIREWNQEAEEIYGYQRADILGQNYVETFVPQEAQEKISSAIAQALSGNPPRRFEHPILTSSGKMRILLWNVTRLLDEKNTPLGVIMTGLDITRRKEAEETIIAARDQALEASRLKSELLSKMSHEFRTPLGAILGFSQIMQSGAYGTVSGKQIEKLGSIINSTHYLTRLVEELLDEAKLQAGQLELHPTPFAMIDLIAQVEAQMGVLAQAKGLAIDIDIAPDFPPTIWGDEIRLQQILVNLIGNAVKFTNQGGVDVYISKANAHHWRLQVADTGIGIAQEDLALIFTPFGQVDGSWTRIHEGTGLGLSIVRQLTELMGGEVEVKSKVGEGTVFIVRLPLILEQTYES